MSGIVDSGDIADVDAFEAAIKEFADQFSWEEAAESRSSSPVDAPVAPAVDPATGGVVGDEA
jgi:hypothetical protein